MYVCIYIYCSVHFSENKLGEECKIFLNKITRIPYTELIFINCQSSFFPHKSSNPLS